METNEARIEAIIGELESVASKKKGYFSTWQYGGGPDESFIKANRDGLRLYAIELLKASLETDNDVGNGEVGWLDGDSNVFLRGVELTPEDRLDPQPPSALALTRQHRAAHRLIGAGCLGTLLFLFYLLLLGFDTFVKGLAK